MSYFGRPPTSFSNNNFPASQKQSSSSYYNPNIHTIRPNNGQQMPKSVYGRNTSGLIQPTESRWSFANGYGSKPQQPQQSRQMAATYSPRSSSGNLIGRNRGPSVTSSYQPSPSNKPTFVPSPPAATGSQRPAATNTASIGGENAQMPEGDNVKYVKLNWEDILGGKDGMNGLRVMMSPTPSENGNRQIQIGVGSPGDSKPAADGSIPLKILKFEPVENYPGQMTSSSSVTPTSSSNPIQPQRSAPPPVQTQRTNNAAATQSQQFITVGTGSNGQTQYPVINLPPGYKIASNMGMQMNGGSQGGQMMMMPMSSQGNNGNNNGQMMMMPMQMPGNNNNNGNYQQLQRQPSNCGNCAACQFQQPTSYGSRGGSGMMNGYRR